MDIFGCKEATRITRLEADKLMGIKPGVSVSYSLW
jgi:hypothetical protein